MRQEAFLARPLSTFDNRALSLKLMKTDQNKPTSTCVRHRHRHRHCHRHRVRIGCESKCLFGLEFASMRKSIKGKITSYNRITVEFAVFPLNLFFFQSEDFGRFRSCRLVFFWHKRIENQAVKISNKNSRTSGSLPLSLQFEFKIKSNLLFLSFWCGISTLTDRQWENANFPFYLCFANFFFYVRSRLKVFGGFFRFSFASSSSALLHSHSFLLCCEKIYL